MPKSVKGLLEVYGDMVEVLLVLEIFLTKEIRCYCKVLNISFKDRITYEEACAKIQQTIRPDHREEMQTKVVLTRLLSIRSVQ